MHRWLWVALGLVGCGGGPSFYEPCAEAAACEELVPEGATAECVDGDGAGFCSWTCADDAGCANDADDDWDFVCAPFESTDGMYCFPACADGAEEGEECPDGYGCRSTGGGSENRKICFPS